MNLINEIKSLGFRVFSRNGLDSNYCYYSDGKNIGYAQSYGLKICAVHKLNFQTGTGFIISEGELTKKALEMGFAFAPDWAASRDLPSVQKYPDLKAFLNASDWNKELKEV